MKLWNHRKVAAWSLVGFMLTTTMPTTVFADDTASTQTASATGTANATSTTNTTSTTSATNTQLTQDVQQATQTQSQLNDLQTKQNSTIVQIQKLDSQIADTMMKSAKLQQEIDKTQQSLTQQQGVLGDQVKVMYEDGTVSYWEVLLNSTNFSDFVDRFYLLTLIASQDKSTVDQYEATVQQLQQEKAALDAQQQQQKQQQKSLQTLEQQNQAQLLALQDQLDAQNAQIAGEQGGEEAAYQALSGVWTNVPTTAPNLESGTYLWPVPSSHVITSPYGPRPGEFHKGIDIGCPLGTPIVAVGDGTVIMAGPAEGFGHWVVIEHANGLLSVYGHMFADGIKVKVGQHVKAGQVIALSGEDGEATGPHLHFAFATGITGSHMDYVDPMPYLQ